MVCLADASLYCLISLWLMLLCSSWLLTYSIISALLTPLFICWHLFCWVWCSQSDSLCWQCLWEVFSISRIFVTLILILNNKSLLCCAIMSTTLPGIFALEESLEESNKWNSGNLIFLWTKLRSYYGGVLNLFSYYLDLKPEMLVQTLPLVQKPACRFIQKQLS